MIQCTDLTVDYFSAEKKRPPAVNNLSLTIKESEFVCIMGPNGSGKSTLATAISGLQRITSGSIEIDGETLDDLMAKNTLYSKIGVVFQDPDNQLITNFVDQEVAFSLENQSVPPEDMRTKVYSLLERFGLLDFRDSSPANLSGGQKQKLAIASVLVSNPKYLILDEPTSYLDPKDRKNVFNMLRQEFNKRKAEGFTIILVTQFSREAAACDRLLIMNGGELASDDIPGNIFSNQQDLLHEIGIELPVENRLQNAFPQYAVSPDVFEYVRR